MLLHTLTTADMKKTMISNTDDCQLRTLVNSASMAAPIGLLPKGAKFCHTLNLLVVGHQCHRAPWQLYFNSSGGGRLVVGCQLVVSWLVHNKGCWFNDVELSWLRLKMVTETASLL